MSLTLSQPASNRKVLLGHAVEFLGSAGPEVRRVELVADGEFTLPTATVSNGKWFVANRFNSVGTRRVVVRGFDAADVEVGSAEVEIVVTVPDFRALVPIPAGINKGITRARQSTMLKALGKPGALSADCTPVTSPRVKALLVTRNVGPFAVTGIRPAVDALERVFSRVGAEQPDLFKVLGTAGMLCCRRVRRPPGEPPSPNFSNHSWGTAVDVKIKGALDTVGDGRTQMGVLLLSPFFHQERFFWGAGFSGPNEDAMHFEASDELVGKWRADGLLD